MNLIMRILRTITCPSCPDKIPMPEPEPPSLEAYDNWVRQQVGTITRYETTWLKVKAELEALGLKCMASDAPDTKVFYVSETSLAKMIPFLTYPADYYVAELDIDCDDYSKWAASDASRIFKVNGIWEVWGMTPLGYHALSLAKLTGNKYKLWESNAGFEYAGTVFSFGDYEYTPNKWKQEVRQ